MKLLLKRIAKKEKYTIGKLYLDGTYVCDTIEDKDRGLNSNMKTSEILKKKIKTQTAIPTGTYQLTINVVSPKFSKKSFYIKNANGGRVPRLLNVPGFDGILIHSGVNENSSAGCLIVGYNKVVGKVINSQEAFIKLYGLLKKAKVGEKITIEII